MFIVHPISAWNMENVKLKVKVTGYSMTNVHRPYSHAGRSRGLPSCKPWDIFDVLENVARNVRESGEESEGAPDSRELAVSYDCRLIHHQPTLNACCLNGRRKQRICFLQPDVHIHQDREINYHSVKAMGTRPMWADPVAVSALGCDFLVFKKKLTNTNGIV